MPSMLFLVERGRGEAGHRGVRGEGDEGGRGGFRATRNTSITPKCGTGMLEYARRLASTRGKRDGLFWTARPGEPESPLGPFVAEARAEGYPAQGGGRPVPSHGYL